MVVSPRPSWPAEGVEFEDIGRSSTNTVNMTSQRLWRALSEAHRGMSQAVCSNCDMPLTASREGFAGVAKATRACSFGLCANFFEKARGQ
jgi:hypothetical protein